ncbi:MAG: elongation factor P [Erythrobacter sp.]
MRKFATLAAAILLAGASTGPLAAQGRLGLVEQGEYICALPGDATGAAWIVQEGKGFAIIEGSSYRTERGSGTYLAEGRQVTFTRGPLKGMKLMRLGSGLLQEIGRDGKLGRLRCHRAGPLR